MQVSCQFRLFYVRLNLIFASWLVSHDPPETYTEQPSLAASGRPPQAPRVVLCIPPAIPVVKQNSVVNKTIANNFFFVDQATIEQKPLRK